MSRAMVACLHLILFTPTVAWAADDPVSVEVLDVGQASGRRPLRLSFVAGSRSKLTMTMKMGMNMRVDGNALPAADIPAVEIVQTCDVVDVDKAGNARIAIRCERARVLAGPDVPQAVVQAMEAAMGGIDELRGDFRISNRGIMLEGEFDVDAAKALTPQLKQMLDAMQQSLEQMSMHFPLEPIGKGGKWRTVMHPTANGIDLEVVTTNTVTELVPDGLTLDIEIEQSAEPQDIRAPGVPAGAMRLEKGLGGGSGTSRYALDVPFPIEVSSNVKTDMQMTMRQGEQVTRMDTTLLVDLKLVGERVESGAPVVAGR